MPPAEQLGLPGCPPTRYHPAMDQPEHILQDLRTGVASALQRAAARLSHAQRQLAGWTPVIRSTPPAGDAEAGWNQLETQAECIAGEVDTELMQAQQELVNFLQQARALASTSQALASTSLGV